MRDKKPKECQLAFFDRDEYWKEHWQDMPEFEQENETPFKEIVVKFRNRKDMNEFMDIIGQSFTSKTKSLWYPRLEIKKISHLRYVVIEND